MQQMSLGFQRGSAAAFEKDIGNWHVSLSIHGGDCNLLVKVENVGCIFLWFTISIHIWANVI